MANKYDDWTPQAGKFTPATAAQKDLGTAHPATQGFWDKLNPLNEDTIRSGTNYWSSNLEPGTTGEALARGLTQGATLGLGNKAQALIRSALPSNPDYATLRDQGAQANEAASNAHPMAYGAGVLTGSIPSALAVGAGGLRAVQAMPAAASTAAKVAAGAAGAGAGGAAVGTVQGLGAPDPSIGSVAKSAAINGGLSALGGGLSQGFAPLKAAITPVKPTTLSSTAQTFKNVWTQAAQDAFDALPTSTKAQFLAGQGNKLPTGTLPKVLQDVADQVSNPGAAFKEVHTSMDAATMAAKQAAADAAKAAAAGKTAGVVQVALPVSGAATGVLFPGVMPGTSKVDPNSDALDQVIQHGKNAAVGALEAKAAAAAPGILSKVIPKAAQVGSDLSNMPNGNLTPGTSPLTGDKTDPVQEYPAEPYTPSDPAKYQDWTPNDKTSSSGFGKIANFLAQDKKVRTHK